MQPTIPETLKPILDLSKARELLLLEAKTTMPKGGQAQRDLMVATLERQINNALAATSERLPPRPNEGTHAEAYEDGGISAQAWTYIEKVQEHPAATPTGDLPAYDHLKRIFADCSDLYQTAEIMKWAVRTKAFLLVHAKTIEAADTASTVFMHRLLTLPEVKQWIGEVDAMKDTLSEPDQRNFTLMKRRWMEAAGLDKALVQALNSANSTSGQVWAEAKLKNDFAAWLPYFEKVVACARKKGEAIGEAFGVSPYEALLSSSDSNPGLSNETVNHVFGDLRAKLPGLVQRVMEKQAQEAPPISLPSIPMEQREKLKKRLMKDLGLDENHVKLSLSSHPCSLGQWDDVRITTYETADNILDDIRTLIHETGHAIYSCALPRAWKDQPIGEYQSIWVHESQSLFWEKQVTGSKEFMQYLSRILTEEVGPSPAWAPENLYKVITRVEPGLNRVSADEVTYPAHVILRHDLEQKLIDGTLAPKDVPAAWAKAMKEMLNVDVPNDTQGCMQDIQWARGAIGYFPAYTFGALAAAQLMEKLREEMPDLGERIKNGDFAPIREWLGDRIHQHAAHYTGEELIQQATGKPLSADAWLKHVNERYLDQEVATTIDETPAKKKWVLQQSGIRLPHAPLLANGERSWKGGRG